MHIKLPHTILVPIFRKLDSNLMLIYDDKYWRFFHKVLAMMAAGTYRKENLSRLEMWVVILLVRVLIRAFIPGIFKGTPNVSGVLEIRSSKRESPLPLNVRGKRPVRKPCCSYFDWFDWRFAYLNIYKTLRKLTLLCVFSELIVRSTTYHILADSACHGE